MRGMLAGACAREDSGAAMVAKPRASNFRRLLPTAEIVCPDPILADDMEILVWPRRLFGRINQEMLLLHGERVMCISRLFRRDMHADFSYPVNAGSGIGKPRY